MKGIYVKRYSTDKGEIIAMCDEELIGKEFSEGKRKLDLKRYADFYKGELLKDGIEIEVDDLYSANIVGERSVNLVISKGIASENEVMEMDGIKYLQIYRLFK